MSDLMCELCGIEPSKFLFGGKRVGQKCAAIVITMDKVQPSVFRIGGFEARVIRKGLRMLTGSPVITPTTEEVEAAIVLIPRLTRGIKEKQF